MASVADLVEPEMVWQMADPTRLAQGEADADAGRVTLMKFGPLAVTAKVGERNPETVELRSTPQGLQWSCTCPDGQAQTFCRHAVAAALVTWRKAPKRRN